MPSHDSGSIVCIDDSEDEQPNNIGSSRLPRGFAQNAVDEVLGSNANTEQDRRQAPLPVSCTAMQTGNLRANLSRKPSPNSMILGAIPKPSPYSKNLIENGEDRRIEHWRDCVCRALLHSQLAFAFCVTLLEQACVTCCLWIHATARDLLTWRGRCKAELRCALHFSQSGFKLKLNCTLMVIRTCFDAPA